MVQDIVTSFLAFVSTNIDDLFILMLFFGSARFRSAEIFAGQYLGIAVLVAVSYVGSLVGMFFDSRFVGLLGLFPIYLAIRQFVALLEKRNDAEATADVSQSSGMISIAGVTIANGGDNIGVYIPLLATHPVEGKIALLLVFAVMVAVWCWLAKRLASHPRIARPLKKYGHIIMPIVLLLLGVFILYENGTINLLWNR